MPLGMVRFCRAEVLFIIENLWEIRDGSWPKQDRETGYTDAGVRGQPRQSAPFEKSAQIAAEVDLRLSRCGIEGKLLEYEVQDGRELSETSYQVLNYVSGWRRKRQSYNQWKADRNRQKTHKFMVLRNMLKVQNTPF